MLSFFTKKTMLTAVINDRAITVKPKETLLQAALREGIDFPHSCRVGGCATCKCKLTSGKVKELTQTAYILTDDDLDQGFILACQSVPTTDVNVQVDFSANKSLKQSAGRVLAQEKLTHDIVALRIQLEETMNYKAGQYAQLSVDAMPDVKRSYSFATPMQMDSQVTFFVRKVQGGQFSSLVYEENLIGQRVMVQGPMGDFWLRPSSSPLLLLAGGSGLAPILAMLQEAMNQRIERDAVLLFGARTQADLYGLSAIQEIANRWAAKFTFIPVLSQEPDDSDWSGARGLVTEFIDSDIALHAHAYLCGPPMMVDAAVAKLSSLGIPTKDIHADRFTTQFDVLANTQNLKENTQ